MLKAKRVYEPRSSTDGTRVLVMRLWPRGIKKAHVDLWLKDLGAELGNLRAYNAGRVSWPEMRRRYLAGLKREPAASALKRLKSMVRRGRVTVLCSCQDEKRCHRGLLRKVGERLLVRAGPASLWVTARFQPVDHATERGTRVDFTGDKVMEQAGLFQATLTRFLGR